METKIGRTLLSLGIIIMFLLMTTLTLNTHSFFPATYTSLASPNPQEHIDMLIFLSPQYVADKGIQTAIDSYITAVNNDLSWNTKIVLITQENNDFRKIDQTIEWYYELHRIKACIMVGEDIDTALAGDCDYMEKPSNVPWYTTGGEDAYELSEQGVICQPHTMDICISLLYPTHALAYETKKSHIVSAFNKFSTQRHVALENDIVVFESSDINDCSKERYQQLRDYGDLYYNEDPLDEEINQSLERPYSMYYVHGHSNPVGTDVKAGHGGWFSADYINDLDTPFFGADGCYVGGWWSDQTDNNILDSSIDCTWYGSKIFTSTNVQVIVAGLLSQNGFSYPVSFIENALPELVTGQTLAESVIGHTYVGDTVMVYGDPTFHYAL